MLIFLQIVKMCLNVLRIVKHTEADGVCLRNTLFLAGCPHCCQGCHNPSSWNFENGTIKTIEEVAKDLLDDYCDITISGGEPFLQIDPLIELLKLLKQYNKNIWVYTGYTYEELLKILTPQQQEIFQYLNVLVDGKYIEMLRDLSRFCGSTNQRILHFENGNIVKIE